MILEHPTWLWALACLPVLLLLLWRDGRMRRRACAALAGSQAARLEGGWLRARGMSSASLVLLGIAAVVLAATRPRFGELEDEAVAYGADIMVALDVSRSMKSRDVAPDRLQRAKTDIRDLVEHLEGDRVGLVAFAGEAVLACPLSVDRGFFLSALDQLDVDTAPRGGTQIATALSKALNSLEERQDRDQLIVLITDGEDQESSSLDEVLNRLTDRGVRVIAIGLGDATEGSRIPVGAGGDQQYLTHDGQVVWSKLNEVELREIARRTNGVYVPARNRHYDLGQLYTRHLKDLARSQLRRERRRRYPDQFQWFLGAGLGLLLVGELVRLDRRRRDGPAGVEVPADKMEAA